MKIDIHPEYNVVTVTCSCGNTFETRSTASDLHVELCSECHPFYTGKQKLVDTGGRIDRFERRFGKRKRSQAAEAAEDAEVPQAEADVPEAQSDVAETEPQAQADVAEPEAQADAESAESTSADTE